MADSELRTLLDELERASAANPFAGVRRQSNLLGQQTSDALVDGAQNLLFKALDAAPDPQRTRRYVDAALRLPFDEHEEAVPAALAAGVMLYRLVTDTFEDGDDSLWLDAALIALDRLGGALGAGDLVRVITEVRDAYQVTAEESRRIRGALAYRTVLPDGWSIERDDPALRERVVGMLEAYMAYSDALDDLLTDAD